MSYKFRHYMGRARPRNHCPSHTRRATYGAEGARGGTAVGPASSRCSTIAVTTRGGTPASLKPPRSVIATGEGEDSAASGLPHGALRAQ
jgi:hypothetical protein